MMENGGCWATLVAARVRKKLLSWLERRFCQRVSQQLFQERERFFVHARLTGNVRRVQWLNDELALATQTTLASQRDVTCSLVRTAKKWLGLLPATPATSGLTETPAQQESLGQLAEQLETMAGARPPSTSSGEPHPSLPRG